VLILLANKVVQKLSPARGAVEGWWRVAHDLEESARGVDCLKGRLAVGQLNSGDSFHIKISKVAFYHGISCHNFKSTVSIFNN